MTLDREKYQNVSIRDIGIETDYYVYIYVTLDIERDQNVSIRGIRYRNRLKCMVT